MQNMKLTRHPAMKWLLHFILEKINCLIAIVLSLQSKASKFITLNSCKPFNVIGL